MEGVVLLDYHRDAQLVGAVFFFRWWGIGGEGVVGDPGAVEARGGGGGVAADMAAGGHCSGSGGISGWRYVSWGGGSTSVDGLCRKSEWSIQIRRSRS